LVLALAAALLCSVSTAARGALTVFTDRTAFLAAAGGVPVNETFDTSRTFVVGNNLYNNVNYFVYGTTVGGNGISGGVLNGDLFTSGGQPYGVDYIFPGAVKAWGQDFNGAATSSGLFFTINGQTLRLADNLPPPGTGFYGVVSDTPFMRVDISGGASPNEIYSGDNLVYVPTVPEPTIAGLAAVALVTLGACRRRCRA
jgi:hypothetical protein